MLATLLRAIQDVRWAPDLQSALLVIVQRVKQTLGVDVCSVYLASSDENEYVLRATDGLHTGAVGKVHRQRGVGLIGLVIERAEPVAVSDAHAHPRYSFMAETGEHKFHSFIGVPIIQHRHVVGVLAVRRQEKVTPDEAEVTLLLTFAAQLAGAITHAELSESFTVAETSKPVSRAIRGRPGAPGMAIGKAVVMSPVASLHHVPDRKVEDAAAEIAAFHEALSQEKARLQELEHRLSGGLDSEDRALFSAYVMMLDSETLIDRTIEHINAGLWAGAALGQSIEEHARVFDAMDDDYLGERAEDIRSLGRRLLQRLLEEKPATYRFPEKTILVGDNVSAAELAEVPAGRLAGVVSSQGSAQSHVAILASALGIPAVMGVADLPVERMEGQEMVVDGYRGEILVAPSAPLLKEFERLVGEEAELSASLKDMQPLRSDTLDGVHVPLHINAGLLADISPSLETGAQGVGLYRTEIPFMIRERFPGEEAQRNIYAQVLEAFAPRPVTIRTLDIGGDKVLPYFVIKEENPFLGWRGIRVTLDHPEIFLTQVRAMLRAASATDNLRILLPMISSVFEADEAILLIKRAYEELLEDGEAVSYPRIGVMVEVPSAVYQADALAARVDFISIGTNDLTQYLLAVDRNNAAVADLYDTLHPAVIGAIQQTVQAAKRHGKPVSVCGEMAGDPMGAILLVGMGVSSLSMNAGSLSRVKKVIRSITTDEAAALVQRALVHEAPVTTRNMLFQVLEEKGLGGLVHAGK